MEVLALYLFIGVALGALTGWLADRRGRNFWVYLAFTLLFPFSVVISIPYLLIFTRRVDIEMDAADSGGDRVDRLERLAKLRETGALSETEFETEKARLLSD